MNKIRDNVSVGDLLSQSPSFADELWQLKLSIAPKKHWYPYDILGNLVHLNSVVPKELDNFNLLAANHTIADIGAADGDLSFLLARNGFKVDMIDWPQTNWNGLSGARALSKHFRPRPSVHEIDLDSYFVLPKKSYSLVIFLGILYHLQNPYFVLKNLSRHSSYLFLSTRIARITDDTLVRLNDAPVAYLVDPEETNNDPTNYWIFSLSGLRRLIERTGWKIISETTVGRVEGDSTPANPDLDERAFFLLQSAQNQ